MNMPVDFTVAATATVDFEELDAEDQEVPGEHNISVPPSWLAWPEEKLAGAILDIFHESTPVNELENFDFSVFTPDGREISEY